MSHVLRRRESVDGAQLAEQLGSNPQRAARAILSAAAAGMLDAQTLLGQILLQGRGITRDEPLARQWFRIAAQAGDAMAHNMLGRCLEHGWGGHTDLAAAAQHYRQAAEDGLDWGLYNLANLLATGRGVAQDHTQALQLYLRAAEQGHAKSMNLVGRYHEESLGVAADPTLALHWYQRSAAGGDFRGQFSLAAVLAAQGQVVEAEHWLRQALAGGNLSFFRATRAALLAAAQPPLRALAMDYHRRAAELGDEHDREALAALLESA
ncbi:tetratricopeptide repeat protein [Pseudomonas sp. LS44]|uniref:tetratricopeptide repeat protein n=1 Tax=Pseudomonas sp. LS44 TaxID=1357074 RepID=UPI0035C785B5